MKKRNQIKGAAAILACMLAVEAGAYHIPAAYAQNAETEAAAETETETEMETEAVATEEIVETESLPAETEAAETEKIEETEALPTETEAVVETEVSAEVVTETEAAKEETEKSDIADKKESTAAEKKTAVDTDASSDNIEVNSEGDEPEADLNADVEKAADWEKTLPKKFAHKKADATETDYRADIVAVANSQIDYQESAKNFVLTKYHEKAFWNRYGAWAGDAYADPWDAEFAAFVLDYAGVTDVPFDGDTAKWTHKLAKEDRYFDASYKAEAGDIVFLQEKDGNFHVAIITDVKEKEGANELTIVGATVGEERDFVKEEKIAANDERIAAFSPSVKKAIDPIDEKETEKETNIDKAASSEPETEKEQKKEQKTEINAKVFTDETQTDVQSDVLIQVSGKLPDGAAATAWPVHAMVSGEETYAAYRLLIKDKDGNEIHSDASDDLKITVTIHDESLTKALLGNESAHAWHEDNGAVKGMAFTLLPDGGVQFDADIF